MDKTMTLEMLASIKGATSSDAIDKLFSTIKKTVISGSGSEAVSPVVTMDSLRKDHVIMSSETEKSLIKQNFPKEENGYLVVAKVID